jgi:15-cis-phytoene synthase
VTDAAAITRASRSNLALAFLALPRERRRDITTFYAFCRVVDDIADGTDERTVKAAALSRWRDSLVTPAGGEGPIASEVREIIAKYSLPVEHFSEIIAGVEMDLDGANYATWDALRLYCHRVASVVGLVSIEIFGARNPASRDYALNLGLALQLTNILRDVGQDFANGGRVYLPLEDMARFGVSREHLAAGRRSDEFVALMDFEAERAATFYRAASVPLADRRALVAAEIMRAIYSELLSRMRADGFHVFDRRYSLGRARKLWLVLRGWLGWL